MHLNKTLYIGLDLSNTRHDLGRTAIRRVRAKQLQPRPLLGSQIINAERVRDCFHERLRGASKPTGPHPRRNTPTSAGKTGPGVGRGFPPPEHPRVGGEDGNRPWVSDRRFVLPADAGVFRKQRQTHAWCSPARRQDSALPSQAVTQRTHGSASSGMRSRATKPATTAPPGENATSLPSRHGLCPRLPDGSALWDHHNTLFPLGGEIPAPGGPCASAPRSLTCHESGKAPTPGAQTAHHRQQTSQAMKRERRLTLRQQSQHWVSIRSTRAARTRPHFGIPGTCGGSFRRGARSIPLLGMGPSCRD